MTTAELHALRTRAARERAEAETLAHKFDVPTEVAEFLVALASDLPHAKGHRIGRVGDTRSLKRFDQIARQFGGAVHQELFYWDGVAYLLGFHYGR